MLPQGHGLSGQSAWLQLCSVCGSDGPAKHAVAMPGRSRPCVLNRLRPPRAGTSRAHDHHVGNTEEPRQLESSGARRSSLEEPRSHRQAGALCGLVHARPFEVSRRYLLMFWPPAPAPQASPGRRPQVCFISLCTHPGQRRDSGAFC
uniref:Uncharacterized protein n=1 Tax=Myotis myotis TaxID=51298 RepID=A0A7J7VYR2_MYOMY|nr:hypothetical protein mMyoMyo1_012196 [Myotis myotis]